MALIFDSTKEEQVNAEINTTPLVDVMLVLLIIFLITIPVVTHTIPVKLPHESDQIRQTKPDTVNLSVDKAGIVYWGTERIGDADALTARLKQVSVKTPQPEVQIRGDADTRYASIGRVIFACQRAGIVKVGFVTEPAPGSAV
jgi:biopolymer transport protein ExbD